MQGLATEYAYLPGFAGLFLMNGAIAPLLGAYAGPMNTVMMNAVNAAAAAPFAAGAAGAAGAAAAQGALGSGFAAGLGGLSGLGQAASVGGLSVPPSWGFAATGPAAMLGGVPLAMSDTGLGAGAFSPLLFGGLPRAAAMGATGPGGIAAAKYGPRLGVVARPTAAGYGPLPVSPPAAVASVPAGLLPAPHGYTPAIVYLPTNGHAPKAM